ncbi:MAG: GspH/FimT family pseudopilin [Zoogloeaceae bacterium]|nr:GspH/FimT family pseudopilin [Zoogloeaceae bacterium]
MNFFEFDSSHEVCGLGAARSAAGCSCAGTPAAPVSSVSLVCSSARERGFTLVELMVVVIIIAVLAAFAVPSFQDMIQRGQATNAMHEVLANLKLARSEAARRGQDVFLVKNTADKKIEVRVGNPNGESVQESQIPTNISINMYAPALLPDNASQITFKPRGNIVGSTVKITVTHDKNPNIIKRCLRVDLGGMVKTFQDDEADANKCGDN